MSWVLVVFGVCAAAAACIDLRELRVPDVTSLGGLGAVLGLRILLRAAPLESLLAAAVGFTVFLLLNRLFDGGLGLGDAKLSALIAAALGFPGWCIAVLAGSLAGIAWAFVAVGPTASSRLIPFAPFLALGSAAALGARLVFPGVV